MRWHKADLALGIAALPVPARTPRHPKHMERLAARVRQAWVRGDGVCCVRKSRAARGACAGRASACGASLTVWHEQRVGPLRVDFVAVV